MGKYDDLNETMRRIMDYLTIELADGAKFVHYKVIAEEVERSYHSVKYSIERLRRMGKLRIEDGKLALA